MDRRQFIKASAASMALFSSGMSISGSAMRVRRDVNAKVNVGMHVWVYAKHQANYDVSNILEKIWQDVSYSGIEGVELMEHPLRRVDKVAELKLLIDKYNLPLIGTSYGGDFWDATKSDAIFNDLSTILKNMESLQARTIGISVGRPNGRIKTAEELDTQAALISKVTSRAAKHGVVLNMHNHTYEVENDLYDLKQTLLRILSIKLGPDINWLIRAGVEPNSFLKTYKDNIVFLHLRDQYDNGQWSESLGEGDTDFKQISATLKEISFKGDAIIELAHEDGFKPTRPLKESLRKSRAFVSSVFAY